MGGVEQSQRTAVLVVPISYIYAKRDNSNTYVSCFFLDDKKGFDNKWKRPSGHPVQPLTLLPENPPFTPDQHPGGSLLDRIFGLKLFGPKDDQ